MALDASNENTGVIATLIDDVERGLGDLTVRIFPNRTADSAASKGAPNGQPAKVASQDHRDDIKVAMSSISGLLDDLMAIMEDGTLAQTPALMTLVKSLIDLKGEGSALLEVFALGNPISTADRSRLDSFLTQFGDALTQARDGTSAAPTKSASGASSPKEKATGDVASAKTTQQDKASSGDSSGAAKTSGNKQEKASDNPGQGSQADSSETTLADVTTDAQSALDDLELLLQRFLKLMIESMDVEAPQVVDGVGFSPYVDRVRRLIGEIKTYIDGFISNPDANRDLASAFIADKQAEADDLKEVLDALDATDPVDDADPKEDVSDSQGEADASDASTTPQDTAPDNKAAEDPDKDTKDASATGGNDDETEEDASETDVGTAQDTDEVEGDAAAVTPSTKTKTDPLQEPKLTVSVVTREAQDTLDDLGKLDDLLGDLMLLEFDAESTQLADGVAWSPYIEQVRGRIQKIGSQINTLLQSGDMDLEGAMAFLADQGVFIEDLVDFIGSVQATLGPEGGVPVEDVVQVKKTTKANNGPTRADVTTATQATLDDLDALNEKLLDLLLISYDPDAPQLADGVGWSDYMETVSDLRIEIRDEVLEMLSGPEPDIKGALDFLAAKAIVIDNIADFATSLKEGGTSNGVGPDPENPPALDWDSAPPASRADLVGMGQALLDNLTIQGFDILDLMGKSFDPDNPKATDAIEWSGFNDEVSKLIQEIITELPPLLAGDMESGTFDANDIQAAFNFLLGKRQEFKALKERVDSIVDLDVLAVDQGRVWGDPHFVGADGGKYDVQGVAGSIYNILSDAGIQVNARFDQFGGTQSGATVMGAIGITLGTNQIEVSKTGEVEINGETVTAGTYLDGAVTVMENGSVQIKDEEYDFRIDVIQHSAGNYLNIENIRSDNAAADGVLPSGLWGVTVDYDDDARDGDSGLGTQGGGAIETIDGEITEEGDTQTVHDYEVDHLFDTDAEHHNRFSSATG